MMLYCVHIIMCEDGSYYTGYTKNLKSRIDLHINGKGAKYLNIHPPKKLVYVEKLESIVEAMRRERRIKKLTHQQKHELINS